MKLGALLLIPLLVLGVDPAFLQCLATDSGGSAVTSLTTPVTASHSGKTVYIITNFKDACTSSSFAISNVGGDTWHQIGSSYADASGAMCTAEFYASNINGNANDAWTVTLSGAVPAQDLTMSVMEIQNVSATPFDAGTNVTGFGNVTTTVTSGSWTTSTIAPNQLAVAGVTAYGIGRTWTADTGWTINVNCTASPSSRSTIQYKLLTSTQTGATTTVTASSATYLDMLIATFAAPAAGGGFVTGVSVISVGP